MTKLGTPSHIKKTYIRGRDYIFQEVMTENVQVGLQLLKGYIISEWETITWLIREESDAN